MSWHPPSDPPCSMAGKLPGDQLARRTAATADATTLLITAERHLQEEEHEAPASFFAVLMLIPPHLPIPQGKTHNMLCVYIYINIYYYYFCLCLCKFLIHFICILAIHPSFFGTTVAASALRLWSFNTIMGKPNLSPLTFLRHLHHSSHHPCPLP